VHLAPLAHHRAHHPTPYNAISVEKQAKRVIFTFSAQLPLLLLLAHSGRGENSSQCQNDWGVS